MTMPPSTSQLSVKSQFINRPERAAQSSPPPPIERGLIYSYEMVKAALAGLKTQTRRLTRDHAASEFLYVNGNPTFPEYWKGKPAEPYTGWVVKYANLPLWLPRFCPYGNVGDILWMRESLRMVKDCDSCYPLAVYDCDRTPVLDPASDRGAGARWLWKNAVLPARYMPRWAARKRYKILKVRAERVRSITINDSIAEGLARWTNPETGTVYYGLSRADVFDTDPRKTYARLWDSLNGKRLDGEVAWIKNPYVWVLDLEDLTPEIHWEPLTFRQAPEPVN